MRAQSAVKAKKLLNQLSKGAKGVEIFPVDVGLTITKQVNAQLPVGNVSGLFTSATSVLLQKGTVHKQCTRLAFGGRTVNPKTLVPRGNRWQSSSAGNSSGSSLNVSEIQKSLAKTAVNAKGRTTAVGNALYKRLPAQYQQMLHNAKQPGNTQRVIKLQLEAFWHRHSRAVLAVAGVFIVYSLWRTLFYFANIFFRFSESMADLGFLALAAALASFGYLYVRRLWTINPDSVYRKAMYQLNTNPGILEVMGAPVAGSSLRATVVRGGGLRLKGLVPGLRSKKVQMIFPLSGSERRGLVSLEAKKQKGRYLFKLLAVDAPSPNGSEQRIFLEGDQKIYDKGGVINELRDPFLRALSLKELDEVEDDLDEAAHEASEAQRKREKAAAKLRDAPKPIDDGGGMYFYERTYWKLRNLLKAPTTGKAADSPAKTAATAGEKINMASDPKPPIDNQALKSHQYKKEASVQQTP